MTDWRAEIEAAGEIARRAGELVMEIYRTDFEVSYKSGSDPVTDADRKANALIVEALRDAFPDDGIVAEENADHTDALKGGRCWYVDPIDGTREFVARNGEFAVMIGLAVDGVATVGAVYQPEADKLYTGAVGAGAQLCESGQTTVLQVSDTVAPADLRLVISRSHPSMYLAQIAELLGVREQTRVGSVGLKVGMLAERRADFYVHISTKSSLWDACAPEAVLKAAGGRFTDLGGRTFDYARAGTSPGRSIDMRNRRGILACNAAAYDAVARVVKAVAEDAGLIDA